MKFTKTFLDGVILIEPDVYEDQRGFFNETYQKKRYEDEGIFDDFVQDNHSISVEGTLRGLHYQLPNPQGKLVRVISGEIFDVIVDIRESSSTFGQWCGVNLSSNNMKQIWIPPGFAHGFLALSSKAEVLYKTTDHRHKENEKTIIWNDKDISIEWPATKKVIVSEKDQKGVAFKKAQYFK